MKPNPTKDFTPLLCWLAYIVGFSLSLADHNLVGAALGSSALLVLLVWRGYSKSQAVAFDVNFRSWRVIAVLSVASIFLLLWLDYKGVAVLCIGFMMYTYAYACLKQRVVYYGGQLRFSDNAKAGRTNKPFIYWLRVLLFSFSGLLPLVLPLVFKRW